MLKTAPAVLPLLLALALPSAAAGAPPLQKAAEAVAAQVAEKPAGLETLFAPEFFRQVSLQEISATLAGIRFEAGPVERVTLVKADGPCSGHFVFETGDYYVPAALSVTPDGERVKGVFFGEKRRRSPALKKAAAELAALPGAAGLLAVRLGREPETLEALNASDELLIGSLFKLYVLGALLKAKVPWDRVYALDEADRSLPPGTTGAWPAGAPATAYSLALAMTAESDNTAADMLISGLGRRNIEAALAPLGHARPELMKPFLRTSELFRLRSDSETELKYANLRGPARYDLLDKLRRAPLDAGAVKRSPFGPNAAGWRASPADLCRLLAWLRASGDPLALEMLARSGAPGASPAEFAYAGYKGGGEPGLAAGAWLLKDKGGGWTCLAAAWNDPSGGDGRARFLEIMGGALAGLR
jgi:beta-lactamase class A